MKTEKKFLASGILAFLFFLLILLLKSVDVSSIGPEGSAVGLSALNGTLYNALALGGRWNTLSTLLLAAAIGSALCFAVLGLLQLLRGRSLRKVSPGILLLGGLYAAVAVLYVLFEKAVINYRPVLEDGALAASFPSSHVMISVTLLGGAALSLSELHASARLRQAVKVLCIVCAVLAVLSRLLSGAHWPTDILGGVLIGGALLCLFSGLRDRVS